MTAGDVMAVEAVLCTVALVVGLVVSQVDPVLERRWSRRVLLVALSVAGGALVTMSVVALAEAVGS